MNWTFYFLFIFVHTILGYHFESKVIDDTRDNGSYFIISHDFDKNGKTDLLAGSIEGPVYWYAQGSNSLNKWTKTLVAVLEGVLHADVFDVNEDGFPDIIVAHKFGGCPENCSFHVL